MSCQKDVIICMLSSQGKYVIIATGVLFEILFKKFWAHLFI